MTDNHPPDHAQPDQERRRAILVELQSMLPPSAPWQDWLASTGELPPDFTTMPAHLEPPELIPQAVRQAGDATASAWDAHRNRLKDEFTHWVLGSCPPPPDNLRAETIHTHDDVGASVRSVRLSFGPRHDATLALELLIPPGDGPFPVLLTQHNHRAWALIALSRGYIGAVYAGADTQDDTDSFVRAYPDYDWSRLTRRAWAASRCVDYLTTLPEVRNEQIAITGHSRNGKQSLIASAYDERIAAVVASSSGAGGSLAARHWAEQHLGEGVESLTRQFPDWFHPRLRFFAGNEQYLPVDMHQLVALSAPRACLLGTAINDPCESAWAVQQTCLAIDKLYQLLGVPERFHVLWRNGAHETGPATIERYLDWLDAQFGRNEYAFPQSLPYPHDWSAWAQHNVDARDTETSHADAAGSRTAIHAGDSLERRIQGMLGTAPPRASNTGGAYGVETLAIAALLRRQEAGDGIEKRQIVMGEYINADLYMPSGLADNGQSAPAAIWLPPWPSPHGYHAAYRRGEQFYTTLARAGFVVCCFDPIGSGRRIEEATRFYQRHPEWSLIGKMVRDVQAALDMLQTLPYVQERQLWGVGYSLGSLVGLHAGAIDQRLAGLAAIAPPAPFREGAGQAWRLSHRDMLLPRLGNYLGQESTIPYDTADLLGAFAPRPVRVVSPIHDRDAPLEATLAAVESARTSYLDHEAGAHLEHDIVDTYNHFGPEIHDHAVAWLCQQANVNVAVDT